MKKIKQIFSQVILFIWGWNIKGDFPNLDKMIVIVAPHRKGFADVLLGWCVRNITSIPPQRFLVKYEALHMPVVGWVLRYLGGIGIDRHKQFGDRPDQGYIARIIEVIEKSQKIALVITPEGTRKSYAPWKRGFYTIAENTGLPVVMVGFDYLQKRVIIREPFNVRSKPSDLEEIRNWYKDVVVDYHPVIRTEDFFN